VKGAYTHTTVHPYLQILYLDINPLLFVVESPISRRRFVPTGQPKVSAAPAWRFDSTTSTNNTTGTNAELLRNSKHFRGKGMLLPLPHLHGMLHDAIVSPCKPRTTPFINSVTNTRSRAIACYYRAASTPAYLQLPSRLQYLTSVHKLDQASSSIRSRGLALPNSVPSQCTKHQPVESHAGNMQEPRVYHNTGAG
jgi:hypothetical protein